MSRTALTGASARARTPRLLHPAAWWLWALCVAFAASRTLNPLVLALLVTAVGFVVAARRQPSPWSRAFVVFLRIALAAVVIRVVLFALLAPSGGGHVLVRLPEVPLPHWLAGLRLGGPVGVGGVLAAAYDGMRLGVILACVGAANALTSPRRLLKSMPASLFEAGVAIAVALAFVPQAVAAVGRVRTARRIRGRSDRGLRGLRGIALPVLEGALERSVDLAAAMESRGFGRRGDATHVTRRATAALTLTGLVAMLASSYGLLDASAPAGLGLPLLLAGAAVAGLGLVVGARGGGRSTYRPEPWRAPEWLTVACAAASVGLFVASPGALTTGVTPPALPALSPAIVVAVALVVLPAWLSPPLPRGRRTGARMSSGRPAAEVPA